MLTQAIKRQFENAFSILEAAIPSFSIEDWRRGSPPFDGPSRAAAHVLQCAQFYVSEDSSAFLDLGKEVWQMSDDETPSQPQMLEYLQQARKLTLEWLDGLGDEGLSRAWHNGDALNAMERVIYALRHLQHHIGEVCAYQKQHGLEVAEWK